VLKASIKLVQQRWAKPNRLKDSTSSVHVYEIRPRADHRGVDLVSLVLPYSPLWYRGPNAIRDAIDFAKFTSRSHNAVIHVYDEAGTMVETHERSADFKEPLQLPSIYPVSVSTTACGGCSCAFHNPVPARAAPKAKVLWLTPRLKLEVGIDYPKTPNNRSGAAGECCGRKRALWFSGYRGRFRYGCDFRYRFGSLHLHRQRDRSGIGSDDNFLYQRTALLPKLSSKEPSRAIGRSTIQAMLSGAVFGYRSLVREILGRIRAEQFLRKKVHIVATGG
jgi:Type III pantothenate kinase